MRLALLATVLLLAACNTETPQPRTQREIESVIDMTDKAFDVVQKIKSGAPAADVQAAKQALSAAIVAMSEAHTKHQTLVRDDKFSRFDTKAYVKVLGCTDANLMEALDSDRVPERIRALWTNGVAECRAKANVYLSAVERKETTEEIAFAAGEIYPIALVTYAMAGLPINRLVDEYRAVNKTTIARLAPECHEWKETKVGHQVIEVHFECVAHNGSRARGTEVYQEGRLVTRPLDRPGVSAQATRLTSRQVALAVLPKLDALPRTFPVSDRQP